MNDSTTERIPILDHGYLQMIESWGSDERIVEAARMSTGKGFIGWGTTEKPGDEKLLRYLHEHKHTTPFEMGGMIIELMAPIMVFREWHRHRTFSFNEMSAPYTPLPDVNYIPTIQRLMLGSDGKNKQAGTIKDAAALTEAKAELFQECLKSIYRDQENLYQSALHYGVPKELARLHLPVGRYSRMRASANLLNWLKFLTLRMAPEAQYEIRMYANAVGDIIANLFPLTWELFSEKK